MGRHEALGTLHAGSVRQRTAPPWLNHKLRVVGLQLHRPSNAWHARYAHGVVLRQSRADTHGRWSKVGPVWSPTPGYTNWIWSCH